jgi:hypothetical protein
VLLRLAYLTITNAFAALRLPPMSDRDKDAEILALRHRTMLLERQLNTDRVKFTSEDRAFLAALPAPLPREVLRRLRLPVQPDTVLRWHRDLIKRRHARTCRPKRPGRPPTVRSIRILILRMSRENPSWGYRRAHGEPATLGISIAASTVREILKTEGIDLAPDRAATTWADFLHSQADALMACDFIETVALTGRRQYILAVIEHTTRRVRILGTTAHPTAQWVSQAPRNLVRDLEDAGTTVKYLIRDRDANFSTRSWARQASRSCSAAPDAAHERHHGALGPDLPPRTPGPRPHLERAPPAPRSPPVRAAPQHPPAPSSDEPGRTTARCPRTDPRYRADLPSGHTPPGPALRSDPRVPTRCLTWPDDIFGSGTVRRRHERRGHCHAAQPREHRLPLRTRRGQESVSNEVRMAGRCRQSDPPQPPLHRLRSLEQTAQRRAPHRVDDVSLGHRTTMTHNPNDEWIWSKEPAHDPLIAKELFEAVQLARRQRARASQQERSGRHSSRRPYVLRGRMRCPMRGRKMRPSAIRDRVYYRCEFKEREATLYPGLDHPRTINLREDIVCRALDAWIARAFTPDRLTATSTAPSAASITASTTQTHTPEQTQARQAIKECERRLARYQAVLGVGADPAVVIQWTNDAQRDREAAQKKLDVLPAVTRKKAPPLNPDQIRETTESPKTSHSVSKPLTPTRKARSTTP